MMSRRSISPTPVPRRPRDWVPPPDGVSETFWQLLLAERLAELTALDVGTGSGRLAFALAPLCRRVIGIDRDSALIDDARRRAAALGLDNTELLVVDAESIEYQDFGPDLVTAHLCMSDAIAERAARALGPGRVFACVAFHTDQWRETGRRSRFAYDEDQAVHLLDRLGFAVEHLEVDRHVQRFRSVEEALAAAVGLEERWKADGRWFRYIKFLEEGGRTLTRSHLILKARRR
jgi:ubiquinone/menaquinone biosynthesis C-methylase UbiE